MERAALYAVLEPAWNRAFAVIRFGSPRVDQPRQPLAARQMRSGGENGARSLFSIEKSAWRLAESVMVFDEVDKQLGVCCTASRRGFG